MAPQAIEIAQNELGDPVGSRSLGRRIDQGEFRLSFSSPRRFRKRGSHRLLDLPQHFSGGDKRGCKPVKDKQPQQQNRDKPAATEAVQRRCWRVC